LKVLLATLAAVLVVVAILVTALALDASYLRGPLVSFIAKRTGREIRIDGPLKAHLLSLHPSLIAERVSIGNPPWSPRGTLAEIGKLDVQLDLPLFGHPLVIRSLRMDGAELHFQRDVKGYANWHWKAPGWAPGKGLPVIQSLSAAAIHVTIDDARRHVSFDGTATTQDAREKNSPLKLTAQGHLNGRETTFTLDGDPLATAAPDKPYHFNLDERSSGSHLTGHGTVPHPFDFRELDVTFEASGADMKDLYYLAGVSLPDTAAYHLSGKITRHDQSIKLSELAATTGQSDIQATVSSETDSDNRAHIEVSLHSRRLRLADIGPRATSGAGESAGASQSPGAGGSPGASGAPGATGSPAAKTSLLPDKPLHLDGLRRGDSMITLHAQQIEAAGASFPVTARLKLDAKPDIPTASLDLDIVDLPIGKLSHKDPAQPPLDGLLQARITLTGHGHSTRELAASANGTVTATIPEGAIRDSLAELMGIDFRGLGLLLTKNKKDTPIRCAVARFQAHQGTLTAQTLVIDTEPVVITGSGTIQLPTETVDLELQGKPKQLRLLRLRAPVFIRGTLAHPSFGIEKENRKLELVDPGHGKDVDCTALLAEAKSQAGRTSPPAEREPTSR
jgi:AsmA family protein